MTARERKPPDEAGSGRLPNAGESRYGAAPASPRAKGRGRRSSARNRLVALQLTEPEVVPITARQYEQAVNALASMILSWARRQAASRVEPQEPDQHATPPDQE